MKNGRVPPQSLTSEKAVLGACLLNESAIFSAMEFVRAGDFYKKEHQAIFQAMLDLNSTGYVCDVVAVSEHLAKQGQLDMVGGLEYLATLTGEVPSLANAEYYSKLVADKAAQRQLIEAAQKVVDDGYQGHKNALELLGDAAAVVDKVGEQRLGAGVQVAAEVMEKEFSKLDELKAHDGITGVPTFRDLDKYLSGLQKGDLIILAARPGCGKTSMAVNIAAAAAMDKGLSAVVFSLEMPSGQLAQRTLCSFARIDQRKWRSGMLNEKERGLLKEQLKRFQNKKLFFDDSSGISIPEMRAKCRRIKSEHGLDLIVVDYLQLMRSARPTESRQLEVAEISRSLKALAKELEVPVLALSQLARTSEQNKDSAPMLSHLRESGAIEQDADVVIFINNKRNVGGDDEDGEGNPQINGQVVEIIVAKNRNGPTGSDELLFFRQYTRFADMVEDFVDEDPAGFGEPAFPPETPLPPGPEPQYNNEPPAYGAEPAPFGPEPPDEDFDFDLPPF